MICPMLNHPIKREDAKRVCEFLERTFQFGVQMLKPLRHLRKVDLQVARQPIGLLGLLIHQLASFLHQVLYPASGFRVRRLTRHCGDRPCCPRDTTLCAYWRTVLPAPPSYPAAPGPSTSPALTTVRSSCRLVMLPQVDLVINRDCTFRCVDPTLT